MQIFIKARHWHRKIALVTALPLLVIFSSGVLLQIKKWVPLLQPESRVSSQSGGLAAMEHPIDWEAILKSAKSVGEARITGWGDVKAIDIRPALGVARLRAKNGYEVQIDLANGWVLNSGRRYTTLLIEIHEGAFFGNGIRNGVFVPTAFLSVLLTLSGIGLLLKFYGKRRR